MLSPKLFLYLVLRFKLFKVHLTPKLFLTKINYRVPPSFFAKIVFDLVECSIYCALVKLRSVWFATALKEIWGEISV